MKFAIHGRPFKQESIEDIRDIFSELDSKDIFYQISATFADLLTENNIVFERGQIFREKEELCNIDVAISLGGDGAFLETLGMVAHTETPVLGINFGRLGFLT